MGRHHRMSGEGYRRLTAQIDWHGVRRLVCSDARSRCHYCKRRAPFREGTVDHVVPKSAGGSDLIDNLVWSCPECNAEKGSLSYRAYKRLRARRGLKGGIS